MLSLLKLKSRFLAKLWCLKEYYCQLVLINFNNPGDTGPSTKAGSAPGEEMVTHGGSWWAPAHGSQTRLSD